MNEPRLFFGQESEASYWMPLRSVLFSPEPTVSGNVVVRVGREHDRPVTGRPEPGGVEQTEHVVLTRAEVLEYIARLQELVI